MKSVCFVGGMRAVIVLLKEGKKELQHHML